MDIFIKLMNGSISMDASVLKGLSRGSHLIAHLPSEEDKDLVMLKKDECFPKASQKLKDAESSEPAM